MTTKSMILTLIPCAIFLAGCCAAEEPTELKGRSSIDFIHSKVEIEALGVPPARLERGSSAAYADALTAAKVMADANLAELLSGLYVETSTSFGDHGATEFVNRVKAELKRTHIPGGLEVHRTSFDEFQSKNQVWVLMRYDLQESVSMLMRSGRFAQHLQEQERTISVAKPPAKTVAPPIKYDSLIVRVPDGFKPTIAPKIYNSHDQLLYGASSLSLDILVAQGVAQYTDDIEKAKASLESHGAKLPLIVNGTLRGSTDVTLENPEAANVLAVNEQGRFLQKGLVFFVIGPKR